MAAVAVALLARDLAVVADPKVASDGAVTVPVDHVVPVARRADKPCVVQSLGG